jgi:hypothetical protein
VILLLKDHAVKKSRYTEEQIAYALKQAETGTPAVDLVGTRKFARSPPPALGEARGVGRRPLLWTIGTTPR